MRALIFETSHRSIASRHIRRLALADQKERRPPPYMITYYYWLGKALLLWCHFGNNSMEKCAKLAIQFALSVRASIRLPYTGRMDQPQSFRAQKNSLSALNHPPAFVKSSPAQSVALLIPYVRLENNLRRITDDSLMRRFT